MENKKEDSYRLAILKYKSDLQKINQIKTHRQRNILPDVFPEQ